MSPSFQATLLCLILCVACSETSRANVSRDALTILADAEDAPGHLAVDERYVYWTSRQGLRRATLDGGEVTTLTSGELWRVVAADGVVYVSAGLAGKVLRVDRESGAVEQIGSGAYPDGIAVHDRTVYWANRAMQVGDGTLAQASHDGSDSTLLAEGLASPSGVAANGDFVFFTSTALGCDRSGCVGGGVTRLSLHDRSTHVMDQKSTPLDVVLGERGAYWISSSGVFNFASFDRDAPQELAVATGEGAGPIAVDAEAMYLGSSNRGRVLKVALDGGEPQAIVTDLGVIGGLAVDRDWVYVAAQEQGRILRVAKDGSAAKLGEPVTGPCPMPLGAAKEIAATPRADTNLELLALTLDPGRITASEESYARVVADVTAIRAAQPELAKVAHFPRTDGRQLLVSPDDQTLQSMRAGAYSAWDCLNKFYGVQDIQIGSSYAVVTLKGIYDLIELSKLYEKLPGIKATGPNWGGGDGPTICAGRNGADYEYVVDVAGGDCPAGCITHEAHAFVSSAPGEVEAAGVWNSETREGDSTLFAKLCRR